MTNKGDISSLDEFKIQRQKKTVLNHAIFLSLGLVVAFLLVATFYLINLYSQVREQKSKELTSIASSKIDEIVAWRNERLANGRVLNDSPLFAIAVHDLLSDQNNAISQTNIQKILNSYMVILDYTTYFLLDNQGSIILQDNSAPEILGATSQQEVQTALTGKKAFLSDLYFVDGTKTIRMDLVAPILDTNNNTIAVVILRIDPNLFLYPLMQSWPVQSSSAETVLFREENNQIVFINNLRFEKNGALALHFPLSTSDLPAVQVFDGERNAVSGKDYRGVSVLAVGRQIPNSPWYLLAKEDQSEIYANYYKQIGITAGIFVLLAGLLIWQMLTQIRRQSEQIANTVLQSELEKQILRQRYNLLFEKGNDIVLILDEEGNIIDANDRAVNSYGYSYEELRGMNINSFRSPMSTHELRSLFSKARKSEGHIYQATHVRKDGSTFTAEVSARFFELEGKGYFLDIVRDISEKQNMIENLAASEARYRSLVEHSTDAIITTDPAGNILEVNDLGCQLTGFTRDELLKMNVADLLDPQETRRMPIRIQEIKENPDRVAITERTMVRKDGSQVSIEVTAFNLPDQQFIALIRDISDRVKHRQELESAAERYRLLFDNNPVPLYVYDLVTLEFLDVNSAALRQYGYTRQEFLRKRLSDIQAEKIDIKKRKTTNEAMGEYIACPWQHKKNSGEEIDVEVTSHSLTYQGRKARLEIAVDVSERLRVEKELKENLNTLSSIISTSPLPMITTDIHGNVTMWNKAAENVFGWTAEEVVGNRYPLVTDPSGKILDEIIENVIHQKASVYYETERKRKDGKNVTIAVHAVKISDYRGKARGILAILEDITVARAAEEAYRQLADERFQLLNRLRLQFNRMPIGFILTDKDLRVLDWNPQAEHIFGFSRDEVLGKSQYDLIIPPDKKSIVESVVRKTTGGRQTEILTHENITKTGERILVEWHNTALYDENGHFVAVMAMAVDVTERVKAENELRESEETLRGFFESPLVGILFGDVNGAVYRANDEFLKIIGYTREELENNQVRWDTITPEEYLYLDELAIQQAQRDGVCKPYEKQYLRRDGTLIWVMVGFVLVGDTREKSIAYIVDISEQKKVEEALIESEANYRGLFTHMFNGLAFCRMIYEGNKPVDFVYLQVNESFENITGLKDAAGKRVSELIPGIQKDNPEIFEIYGRVAKTGVQEKFETYLPGLEIYFSVFVYSPKPGYFVALFEDVSEQKRAEAELRVRQDLLNNTGRIGKIGGWEIDVLKGTSSWTDEVAIIQDINPKDPASVKYGLSFYTPESRPIIERAVNDAVEKGIAYDLELEIITAKGVHKIIRTTGVPEVVDGKVVKVRGIFQDITEIKQAEAEIKALNESLERRVQERTQELLEANSELESFSYSVSHDLRAPIRAIDGFSKILADEFSETESPEILHYLESIQLNTRNMGQLVDDLLAFSRLGKQSVQKQTVHTRKLVNEIIDSVQVSMGNRKVQFVIGELPDCQADINLLRQVYFNLIANAVKFTRNCGSAKIEIGIAQCVPPGAENVENATKTCYYVKDNGVGFDMRYYDKLFGVFQRLHRSEEYEGTGVGLAIVKRIVEKHGGKVWAESVLGSGATFFFTLEE